jgi:hypothetical protein
MNGYNDGQDYQANVARGAAVFDQVAPRWFLTFGEVTPADMHGTVRCALGRVARSEGFPDYFAAKSSWIGDEPGDGLAHGLLAASAYGNQQLADLWNQAAANRLRFYRELERVLRDE